MQGPCVVPSVGGPVPRVTLDATTPLVEQDGGQPFMVISAASSRTARSSPDASAPRVRSLWTLRARAAWDNGAEGPLRAASRALGITQHPSQQSRGVSSRDKLSRASGRSVRSTSLRAPVAVGEKTEHARPVCVAGATTG